MTFMNSATTAHKLAQIDAGIELGMTSGQVALATGCTTSVIRQLARDHGRKFRGNRHKKAMRGALTRKRNAYLRGEAVNFFGEVEADEFKLDQVEA